MIKRCANCYCIKTVHNIDYGPETGPCWVCGCEQYEDNPKKLAQTELCPDCKHPTYWHHILSERDKPANKHDGCFWDENRDCPCVRIFE